MSNYATKADLTNATGADTFSWFADADLVNLKCEVDKLDTDQLKNVPLNLSNLKNKVGKLDVDKLIPVPVDLSKLSDVVKDDVNKRDVYDVKIKNIEDKIPDITNVPLNVKINEVKGEICSITYLATTTALTAVEDKIPYISNLVKNAKISKIENKVAIIMIDILPLNNLLSQHQKILL